MKKNIIAMAVAAAVAAPAAAMADTTLYGKIHASYDVFGGDNADGQDYSLSSNSSRIGIKGKEAISDSLALIYKWETTVDFGDSGKGVGYGPRNTYVGFTGGWGTALAGRHDTPMKGVGRKYELFGDTVGDSRALIRGKAFGNDWDMRTNNTVAYATPDMGGFHAMIAYVSDWDTEDTRTGTDVDGEAIGGNSYGSNDYDAWSMSAGYEIGGFTIDGAYEVHNRNAPVGEGDDQTAYRIGAGYKMGDFKVVGLYQNAELGWEGNDQDVWGIGGAYSFGKSTIKAQYYMADDVSGTTDTDADLWAIGYDYKLSKQTSVYAAYAAVSQGNGANGYSVGKGTGHGESVVYETVDANGDEIFGQDSGAFSLGVVHKF